MTKFYTAKRWAKSLLNWLRRSNCPEITVRDFILTVWRHGQAGNFCNFEESVSYLTPIFVWGFWDLLKRKTWRSPHHRRVLPVLRYSRNMVIYHYPLIWVIFMVILLIFIIQNYPNFFSKYYPKFTIRVIFPFIFNLGEF